MNRLIIFRGKRVDNGEWIYGSLILYAETHAGTTVAEIYFDGRYCMVSKTSSGIRGLVDPATVGQYTGIDDKDGNRIFEGDVVGWIDSDNNSRFDEVKWMDGGLCLCNSQYTVGSYARSSLEVIGNVHDTPGLLPPSTTSTTSTTSTNPEGEPT